MYDQGKLQVNMIAMFRYLIIGLSIFTLSACSLPAPVEEPTSTPPDTPVDTVPTGTTFDDVFPEPTLTIDSSNSGEISPTLPIESPVPTPTIETTAEPEVTYRYAVQSGTPVGTTNIVEPDAGCKWMGVGGQVFSRNEEPVLGLIVEVGGELADAPVLLLGMTGESAALGSGGYEVKLSDQVAASKDSIWLQLHDIHGKPQSDKVFFDTYGGEGACEKNLIIINFSELGSSLSEQYLPSIFNAP